MDRRLYRIGFLLLGALVGLGAAQVAGERFRMRAGRADLMEYATQLERTAILVDHEAESTVLRVLRDGLGFCSPQELSLMRGLVYKSNEVKDIGRVRERRFYCSSEIGVVPQPVPMPVPDTSFRNMIIFANAPVMLGEASEGFVVQSFDVDVVLNPNAFHDFQEPEKTYAAFLYDQPTGSLIQGFGGQLPVLKKEIVAGQFLERDGAFYQPLCAPQSRVCIVAGETRAEFMKHGRTAYRTLLFAGVCLGECFVLALMLTFRRHGSQESQLRRALRREDLTLVYQPIVDLETGEMAGAEALLRWRNEEGRPVSPDVFTTLAEDRGFIGEVTRFVICHAVEELGSLLASDAFRVSVNISAGDLYDDSFFSFLQDTLRDSNVSAASLGLEITERSTANKNAAIAMVARLRRAGHSVYVDDFGTGYSSLAYLQDLAVDAIKVDRAFTATVGTHAITESIVPQILHLAERLGLAVVVEGIETAEQAAYFRRAGGKLLGQGWFYSRPVPASELREMFAEQVEKRRLTSPS
ncbi:MAG TPA: EAL domain-containing protein [Acidobacteriaceae bacterium]|nr:EAL domain-containing protein [Acidobacteriaceae bacterium]